VSPLTVLLATHFLSLQYLPAIGAGASVRLTRLRSRMDLDFFHFLAPINWKTNEGCVIDLNSKVCTNKNHSYKHNEQINKQNIDNFECFGVKFVKIYPEMTSQ
jgi:hypothetical protein